MHKAHPSMSALCHKQTFAALTHSLFCRDLVAELKVADCKSHERIGRPRDVTLATSCE